MGVSVKEIVVDDLRFVAGHQRPARARPIGAEAVADENVQNFRGADAVEDGQPEECCRSIPSESGP